MVDATIEQGPRLRTAHAAATRIHERLRQRRQRRLILPPIDVDLSLPGTVERRERRPVVEVRESRRQRRIRKAARDAIRNLRLRLVYARRC